jgi:hypothetical protein
MYDEWEIPDDFTKYLIIPIQKKARAQRCDQYKTLSLVSHASKIITWIVMKRIQRKIENTLADDYFGFKWGMWTREAILSLRQAIEKRNRKRKAIYTSFVD